MDFATFLQILDSTIRLAMPLLMACLAGLFSERAGIFDIGLEGKMLAAAFLSAAVAFLSGSVWVGLLAGIGVSIVLSIVHGLASITFRGNQLISGVAINFLAAGLTVVVAQNMFEQGGRTPSLDGAARFSPINLPFAEALSGVPILGPVYAEIISGHTILVYLGFALRAADLVDPVPYAVWPAPAGGGREPRRSRHGRHLGHRITLCRRLHLRRAVRAGRGLSGDIFAGGFRQGHVGRARVHRACGANLCQMEALVRALRRCLLFGFLQAIALRPNVIEAFVGFKIQIQLLDALPYILTVVILAGFVGKAIPPRAGGEPYVKER